MSTACKSRVDVFFLETKVVQHLLDGMNAVLLGGLTLQPPFRVLLEHGRVEVHQLQRVVKGYGRAEVLGPDGLEVIAKRGSAVSQRTEQLSGKVLGQGANSECARPRLAGSRGLYAVEVVTNSVQDLEESLLVCSNGVRTFRGEGPKLLLQIVEKASGLFGGDV